MKKIFLVFCIILFLTPIVFAELELEEIRIYVNDKRYSDVDEDGGDIDVKREDDLMLKVYLDNNWDNITYVRLKGELEYIDDGDNIIEWKPSSEDWYDIDANDETSKTLHFKIPDDADYDEYDLDLFIYYNHSNGTEDIWKYSWDVIVKKIDDEEEEEKELETTLEEIKTMIENINCSDQFSKGEEYYKFYLSCFTNYTICDAYRKENQEYKSDYDGCIIEKGSYESAKRKCDAEHYLLNETYNACVIKRNAYSGQRVFWAIAVGILGIVGTYLYLKKGGAWKRKGKMATEKDMAQPLGTAPYIHDVEKKGFKEKVKEKLAPQKEEIPDIKEIEKDGS